MNVIRSLISLLIVVLLYLGYIGMRWWDAPPEKLADSAGAAKVILVILMLSGVVGLVRLWAPARKH